MRNGSFRQAQSFRNNFRFQIPKYQVKKEDIERFFQCIHALIEKITISSDLKELRKSTDNIEQYMKSLTSTSIKEKDFKELLGLFNNLQKDLVGAINKLGENQDTNKSKIGILVLGTVIGMFSVIATGIIMEKYKNNHEEIRAIQISKINLDQELSKFVFSNSGFGAAQTRFCLICDNDKENGQVRADRQSTLQHLEETGMMIKREIDKLKLKRLDSDDKDVIAEIEKQIRLHLEIINILRGIGNTMEEYRNGQHLIPIQHVENSLKNIDRARGKGNNDSFIEKLLNGLKSNALNLMGLLLRERVDSGAASIQDAKDKIEAALALRPNDRAILSNYGFILNEEGNHQEALSYHEQAGGRNSSDIAIRNGYAHALSLLGQYEEANNLYDDLLEVMPKNEIFLNNKAWLLLNWGKYKEALEVSEKAYRLNPTTFNSLYLYGIALFNNKNYEKAFDILEKAEVACKRESKNRYLAIAQKAVEASSAEVVRSKKEWQLPFFKGTSPVLHVLGKSHLLPVEAVDQLKGENNQNMGPN